MAFVHSIYETRLAYIIITFVADVISVLTFLILLFNIDNIKPVNRINFGFIVRMQINPILQSYLDNNI